MKAADFMRPAALVGTDNQEISSGTLIGVLEALNSLSYNERIGAVVKTGEHTWSSDTAIEVLRIYRNMRFDD